MFVVLLKFSDNKAQAGQYMEQHNQWIRRGLEAGHFLLVGSLQPNQGGAILAHQLSRDELQQLLNEDPFVAKQVVSTEILEISPGMADPRLNFLLS